MGFPLTGLHCHPTQVLQTPLDKVFPVSDSGVFTSDTLANVLPANNLIHSHCQRQWGHEDSFPTTTHSQRKRPACFMFAFHPLDTCQLPPVCTATVCGGFPGNSPHFHKPHRWGRHTNSQAYLDSLEGCLVFLLGGRQGVQKALRK